MLFTDIMLISIILWALINATREVYHWKSHPLYKEWSRALVWAEGLLLGIFLGTALGVWAVYS